jgi:large subunit ribosomal protein L19
MADAFLFGETNINSGDTIRVHQEISEGDKKRIQIFEGIVIAIKNTGSGKSFTVRKIGANGIGVEKIYPINMPGLKKLELKSKGHVRRSKLYYLRNELVKLPVVLKKRKLSSSSSSIILLWVIKANSRRPISFSKNFNLHTNLIINSVEVDIRLDQTSDELVLSS